MFSGTMKWLCVESFRFGNIITEIRLPAGGAPATFGGAYFKNLGCNGSAETVMQMWQC